MYRYSTIFNYFYMVQIWCGTLVVLLLPKAPKAPYYRRSAKGGPKLMAISHKQLLEQYMYDLPCPRHSCVRRYRARKVNKYAQRQLNPQDLPCTGFCKEGDVKVSSYSDYTHEKPPMPNICGREGAGSIERHCKCSNCSSDKAATHMNEQYQVTNATVCLQPDPLLA